MGRRLQQQMADLPARRHDHEPAERPGGGPAGCAQGRKARFAPYVQFFWNVWTFSKNQWAAKSLIVHLSQQAAAEKMVEASAGYDPPPFNSFPTFKTWAEEGPPQGTLYPYTNT